MSALRLSAVALALAASFALPAHAASAVSASMSLQARVSVGDATDSNLSTDAWGVPLSSLGIDATASLLEPGGFAFSAGFGSASWASANLGGVSFEGYGWTIDSPGIRASADLNSALPDWQYTFMAGASDGSLAMGYDVFGSGNTFGLWGWSIAVSGGPEGLQQLPVSNAFDPTASGLFTASLTPGNLYTVSLANNANIFGEFGIVADGRMNGNFRWEIRPVPEPQTYAMLALGLACIGVVARRRREPR